MSRKPLTEEQKQAMRERLADVGKRYTEKHGEFPKCRELAHAAAMSVMALYTYFANKVLMEEAIAARILEDENPKPMAVRALCSMPMKSSVAPEIARRFYNNYLPED